MNKDIRIFTESDIINNLAFPLIVGAAFGFGWTPCIGPILGSILSARFYRRKLLTKVYYYFRYIL